MSIDTEEGKPATDFHDSSQDEEVLTYRSPSVLAYFGLAMGAVSSAALAHPVLWVFPVVALIAGFFGLREIAQSDGAKTGRWAAILGICLAVAFLCWAPARLLSRQWTLAAQGDAYAHDWLNLVVNADDMHKAHQLTLLVERRLPEGAALDDYYQGADAEEQLNEFTRSPALILLRSLPVGTQIRTVGSAVAQKSAEETDVRLTMELDPPPPGNEARRFYIGLERRLDKDRGIANWRVLPLELVRE